MLGSRGTKSWWPRACVMACAGAVAIGSAVGCGSSAGPPPAAWVVATILDSDTGTCMEGNNMVWFSLEGTGGSDSSPASIMNGQQYEGSAATISCSVTPSGSGFSVNGAVTLPGGNFHISGTMDPSNTTQTGISTSFTSSTAEFASTDCTFAYTSFLQGFPACQPSQPMNNCPVKAGAVWGTLTCPKLTSSAHMNDSCAGTVQVQLTNCTQ
jgi:hypothetical protein